MCSHGHLECVNALHEQVDKHAQELSSNPKLIDIIVNVARRVPTGDTGYKTDAFGFLFKTEAWRGPGQ
jgi:hypothetical protein